MPSTQQLEYQEWLNGPVWARIRADKLTTSPRCEICDSDDHCVPHHTFYRHPWDETRQEDLVTLCDHHHKMAHPEKYPEFQKQPKTEAPKKRRKRCKPNANKSYYLILPDGTRQKVTYQVTKWKKTKKLHRKHRSKKWANWHRETRACNSRIHDWSF